MIAVSSLFKEKVTADSKEIRAYVYEPIANEYIYDDDDLKYLKISTDGDLMRTVMRQVDIKYYDTHDYLGKYVNVGMGVVLPLVNNLGTFTVTIASPAVVTKASHGLVTGERVKFTTTGALPTGLAVDTYYYVVYINANTFNLASSYANAVQETPTVITTTGSQSGTHTLYHYPLNEDGSPEYVDYGAFKIVEKEQKLGEDFTTVKGFDRMYESLREYYLPDVAYPITLTNYLQAICTELGWTLATPTFTNDSLSVTSDLFAYQGYTFRKVLEQIAEASGSIMFFNSDDELELKEVANTPTDEAVPAESIRRLDIEEQFGDVNSFVIATVPPEDDFAYSGGYYYNAILQEDGFNILLEDSSGNLAQEGLFEETDLWQMRVENNSILNLDRDTYITDLATLFSGYNFYPFEADTIGLLYFEIGDRVTLEDRDDVTYSTNILGITIELSEDSFTETFKAIIPTKSKERYKKVSEVVTERIDKTEIDNKNIRSISADKITAGTISAVANLGDESIKLDGEERRILIADEDGTDRILLGRQVGGF